LGLANPIVFFLTNRTVLSLAAAAEIAVGAHALRSITPVSLRAAPLMWLACCALVYKVGLALVHYKGPCGCLLGINRFLPLRPGAQRWVSDVIVVVAVIVSVAVLILDRRLRGRAGSGTERADSSVQIPAP
jgi:hypothetical protein